MILGQFRHGHSQETRKEFYETRENNNIQIYCRKIIRMIAPIVTKAAVPPEVGAFYQLANPNQADQQLGPRASYR